MIETNHKSRWFPDARPIFVRKLREALNDGAPLILECLNDAEYINSTYYGLWRAYTELDGLVYVATGQKELDPRNLKTLPGAAKFCADMGFRAPIVPLTADYGPVRFFLADEANVKNRRFQEALERGLDLAEKG